MDWISVITIIATTVVTFFVGRLLARVKGGAGEMVVSRRLRRLPEEEYRVFDNVILPTPRGSSQIDHLVVSVYGIFVIETKNYKGWLYGGEKSEYWTQNIYGQKYKLYNPIFQNAGHIRALRRVLADYQDLPVYSIVAFSGRADVKVKAKAAYLVYWSGLRRLIKSFTERQLDSGQVDSISNTIRSVQLEPSKEVKKQHLQNVRKAKR